MAGAANWRASGRLRRLKARFALQGPKRLGPLPDKQGPESGPAQEESRRQGEDHRTAKDDRGLYEGEQRQSQQGILEPDNENIVKYIQSKSVAREIAERPRTLRAEPQENRRHEQAAARAGDRKADVGAELQEPLGCVSHRQRAEPHPSQERAKRAHQPDAPAPRQQSLARQQAA